MSYFIVDIDGTVADCSHRLHHIRKSPPDWDAFFAECVNDKRIESIAEIIETLRDMGHIIVYVSGRSSIVCEETKDWLKYNDLWSGYLYMREEGDKRPDHVVKMEILETLRRYFGGDPIAVFDDRQSVVDAWRNAGLTCLQVAEWKETTKLFKHGTLYMMVGPVGAGKSTYADSNFSRVFQHFISTDKLRETVTGEASNQTENERVFSIAHAEIKMYIEHGVDVVFDATNVRDRDRRAVRDLVKDCKIVYIVCDRPLEEKLKVRDEALVKRYDQIFKSNLKNILAGDNDPRVEVCDMRENQ